MPRPARGSRGPGKAYKPCKPRRRHSAPVPRRGYRGEGAGPSGGLTGRSEGAPGRGGPRGRALRRPHTGPASAGAGACRRCGWRTRSAPTGRRRGSGPARRESRRGREGPRAGSWRWGRRPRPGPAR
nr:MAG TPA: hypothetical protein [Caudoviricetes sp.]